MESEKKTSGGDKYSKLAGNTIIFAISSFSSKLLTLLVQPFLTYAMAEIADLGLAKILSQYANLLIPFVSMGMSNAIIRFGLDKGNSEKQVFTNGLLTILGGFGILILCWPVAQFLPDMAQKLKNKQALVESVIANEQLEPSITSPIKDVYDELVNSKLDMIEGLVPISAIQHDAKMQEAERL